MPPLFNYSGEDEVDSETRFHPTSMAHENVCNPGKRLRLNAPLVQWSSRSNQIRQSSINVLPDECLFEIFRHLPSKERSISACVSKHWLNLLCGIRLSEMYHTTSEDYNVDGCLTRSLSWSEATDTRLTAIAIGTSFRGGLGKLSIRGSNPVRGVTNFGLLAIARGCPSLRSLSIWNVMNVGDEGLFEISKECHKLEKLDLCSCPSFTNKGLTAIAEGCPNLVAFSVESCPNIGNNSIKAIGKGCLKLRSIIIKKCPLVDDQGLVSLLLPSSVLPKVLSKVKLQALNISDFSLGVIGQFGKNITSLTLSNLCYVSEIGFSAMGNAGGLMSLVSLSIASCSGLTSSSLEAIGRGCLNLKHTSLHKCDCLSDDGLLAFSKSAHILESMHLEHCHEITLLGVISTLSSCSPKFRSFSLVKCTGIKDIDVEKNIRKTCTPLRCLSIKDCPNFGSLSLKVLTNMCSRLSQLSLVGLYGLTDNGIVTLSESGLAWLVKLNLTKCIDLTDESILAIVRLHGGKIKVLNLNGCSKITDMSLFSIADSCRYLKDLDVSKCGVTDLGIGALADSNLHLQILSISGCSKISDKSLPDLIRLGKSLIDLNLKHCSSLSINTLDLLGESLRRCNIHY
ncbi:EIN3-binding F-box protein 1-like [Silene latifolia]|uniref:EIN3-binding F-box protein 1-like n=1 Tax=Silene latifolia TaxID=37657 RepID=UPI003D783973